MDRSSNHQLVVDAIQRGEGRRPAKAKRSTTLNLREPPADGSNASPFSWRSGSDTYDELHGQPMGVRARVTTTSHNRFKFVV